MHHDLLSSLTRHETAVWRALQDGDSAADARLLAADFLGVYSDGFADRSDHIAQLAQGPSIAAFSLHDLQARPLGADHALLSYRARFRRIGRSADEEMYVSSVWERAGAGWVNLFSQDTPALSPTA
ncbi:MAG: nuclear transport factor 2 family protein [Marinibacterium sp.]|nr:nuclear transport factor 2 family protein [Marinibacterium sp.]